MAMLLMTLLALRPAKENFEVQVTYVTSKDIRKRKYLNAKTMSKKFAQSFQLSFVLHHCFCDQVFAFPTNSSIRGT